MNGRNRTKKLRIDSKLYAVGYSCGGFL